MKLLLFLLIAGSTIGCGSYYGSKSACDSKFADMQAKVDTLTPNTSTKDQMLSELGQPYRIYSTSTANVTSYSYLVYANSSNDSGYCGQYRIGMDEDTKIMGNVNVYKDYLVH